MQKDINMDAKKIFTVLPMKKKKKSMELNIPLEEIPLDTLVELIESGAIQEEIPFDIMAEHFPELLEDWYPGFPCDPREMTEQDPVCCRGQVRNKRITLEFFEEVSFEFNEDWPEGTYDLFLKKDDNGDWIIIFAIEEEEEEDGEMDMLESLTMLPH